MNPEKSGDGIVGSKSRTNCCVPQCTSYHAKDRSLSFHSFPRKEDLKKQWMHVLKLGKQPGVSARVCSRHFESSDIRNTGKKHQDSMLGFVIFCDCPLHLALCSKMMMLVF